MIIYINIDRYMIKGAPRLTLRSLFYAYKLRQI